MDEVRKVKGYTLGNDVLVWSSEAIEWLNANWRIVGGFMGALPHNPRQNVQLGPPLLLLPEQVALLLNKGVLDIHRAKDCDPTHSDPTHTHRDIIHQHQLVGQVQALRNALFADLWEHGYYLTSGLKYAIVLSWKQSIHAFVSLGRVATKVKKRILLCSEEAGQSCYYTLEWAGN